MREKRSQWLLGMIVLALVTILNCGSADFLSAAPSGALKQGIHWGLSADWLDPASTGWTISGHFTLFLFHDSLVKPMHEELYTPSLAESWKVSSDSKVYEFKLRKGVKFHNGDIMTAEDMVFSFWRYKAAQAKFIHGRTEKVEVIDPYLIRIHFKEPFPDFLDYLLPGISSIGWVVPKKYVEKVGEAGFKKHPVGCGPYKFVEFVPGVKLVAEAFEEYWRKMPNIKRMEFYYVPEHATRLAMVKNGEVDIATFIRGIFYEDAKKDSKLRVIPAQSPTKYIMYMASQWDPQSPWSNERVRKAASLAIDRKTLVDVQCTLCNPIGDLGLRGDPLAMSIPPDPYDPEGAKKLLAQAGFSKGFHGGKFYPFESSYWPYGEQVANYWKAAGISVDTILLDRPAWMAQRESGKMKGGLFIDPVAAPTMGGRLSYLFGPTSYGNYPDILALWEQFNKSIDQEIRKDLMARIQVLVHEKRMFLPLTDGISPAAFGPKVKGNPYKIQPLLWFTCPFEDIELAN